MNSPDPAAPKVSVLVLTYNSARFVRESIDSVLEQNYPSLQIVVSDDASQDDTAAILRDYERRHPGLFTINLNSANLGITRNANAALSLCTGEFVAFHAGDDVMLPGKLKAQIAVFSAHPDCAICYHDLEIFDSDSGRAIGHYNGLKNPAREGTVRELIRHGCFAGGNSVMARRERLPSGGYNEAFPVASDWPLWIATLGEGGTIRYIDKVLARYRRHGANTTSSGSSLNRQAILDALNTANWVMVTYPRHTLDALKSYAIHLRLLRRLDVPGNYPRALAASIRVRPTLAAVIALAGYYLSFGRSRL